MINNKNYTVYKISENEFLVQYGDDVDFCGGEWDVYTSELVTHCSERFIHDCLNESVMIKNDTTKETSQVSEELPYETL